MDAQIEMGGQGRAAQVDFERADQCPWLQHDWCALEADADGSPFTSWPWIATWLATLPAHIEPQVVRVYDDDQVLALGLLVYSRQQGLRRLLGGGILNLQQTGDEMLDEITIEYGGLLVRRGCETQAYTALLKRFSQDDLMHNELHIPASTHGPFLQAALPPRWEIHYSRQRACCVVDLAEVRKSGNGYLDHLSASARSGLRRTRRAFEQMGEIRLSFAKDAAQALVWLEQLRELHQRRWHDEGQSGAFDSHYFHDFHRSLIRHHHDSGLPRLSRVCCGDVVIGYYYYLLHHNRVYFYSSGVQRGLVSKNDRPGLLLHWVAIENDLASGRLSYDFLAGDAAYKKMLGTHCRSLAWVQAWQSNPCRKTLRWLHRQLTRRSRAATEMWALADSQELMPLR
ncbi:MAG: GNAT family N-acetyltransferase [Pseudoxanthomonas sp.]